MEREELLRKYLIYVLRKYDVYYITKNKVDREVYKLSELENKILETNMMANKLFAIKNNEIRNYGYASEKIESLLMSCLNDMVYLNSQKSKGNFLDIKDDDTLQELADKLRNICVDGEIDIKGHDLSHEEEQILENAKVNELKTARKKGIQEEREYIKKRYQEVKQNESLEDIELSDEEELVPEYSLTYKLRKAREQGLKAEERFLNKK